jgi:hypothetical protein
MSLQDAIENVKTSIDGYRKVSAWIPNDDAKDNLLYAALKDENLDWAGLGAIVGNRGPRLSYLQDPIEPLTAPFEDTTGFQFTQGTTGWWFTYGMDSTGDNGWLLIVFRYPTITSKQASYYIGTQTLYNIGGYIVSNGIRYPLSKDGYPLSSIAKYEFYTDFETSVNTYSLTYGGETVNDNLLISNFVLKVTDSGSLSWVSTFKDGSNFDIEIQTKHAAVPHGDLSACAPCVSGIGTNYWSWTYMEGSMKYTPQNGIAGTANVIAWFDHQWGTLSKAPRNAVSQILATVGGAVVKPSAPRWFWVTIVLGDSLQYSCSIVISDSSTIQANSVFTSSDGAIKYAFDDKGNPDITFGLPVTIKVNSVLDDNPNLSSDVTVTVENVEYHVTGIVETGYVTLYNGSINQEVPCIVKDSNGSVVGNGFLEMNNMHTAKDNATSALKLMGQDVNDDNLAALMPSKYTFSQAWESISVVVSIILVCLIAVVLMIWGLVKLF